MKRILALAVLSFVLAAPAAAQTAEEAVAYAFLGLSDGGHIDRATTVMDWKESSASPAVFDGDAKIQGHPLKLKFTVAAVDPCNYEVTLEGPEGIVPGRKRLYAKIALANVKAVTIIDDGKRASVDGEGFCETGRSNTNCMTMFNPDLFASVDAARHGAAVAYLKGEVCKPAN